jgi:hypothetical protein
MNSEQQRDTLKAYGFNDYVGHTLQANRRCKCGASEWPHSESLRAKPCFTGGGRHNFASDGVCQDCGNGGKSVLTTSPAHTSGERG